MGRILPRMPDCSCKHGWAIGAVFAFDCGSSGIASPVENPPEAVGDPTAVFQGDGCGGLGCFGPYGAAGLLA